MTKTKGKKKIAFADWLKKEGLTLEVFCRVTGIKFSTAQKWAYIEAVPRDAYADIVRKHYPKCPLVA